MTREQLIDLHDRVALYHVLTRDELRTLVDFAIRAQYEATFALEVATGAGQNAVALIYPALVAALKRAVGR